jgi:hypothetical protein
MSQGAVRMCACAMRGLRSFLFAAFAPLELHAASHLHPH